MANGVGGNLDRIGRTVLLLDQLRGGGTERQVLWLADELARRYGTEAMALLVFSPGGRLEVESGALGLDPCFLQRRDRGLPLLAPDLCGKLRSLDPASILFFGRSAHLYCGRVRSCFPAGTGVRLIGTLRTGKRLTLLHRKALARLDAVVANAEWWRQTDAASEGLARSFEVIPNALWRQPLAGFERDKARERGRARLGCSSESRLLVNLAGFRRGKRQEVLIRMLADRVRRGEADWHLVLVGDGPFQPACRRLVRKLGLGERVHFAGFEADPRTWLAAADLAVSASLEDSLPNFLIEAQAAGLPFVAVDYRGVGEVGLPGETASLVSPPGSPEDLARAVEAWFTDAARRYRASQRAREEATRRFDPERVLSQWTRLLRPRFPQSGFAARATGP